MKLWEAIELGNTLIGETHGTFYNSVSNCGCAIGSAMAAMGVIDPVSGHYTNAFYDFPLVDFDRWITWCHREWPWTREPVVMLPELMRGYAGIDVTPELTIAEAISLRHYRGTPRMEIAAMIRPYEDALEDGDLLAASRADKCVTGA